MMCIFTYLILHWIRTTTSNQSLPKTFVSSKACRLGWPPFASGLDPRTKLDAQFLGRCIQGQAGILQFANIDPCFEVISFQMVLECERTSSDIPRTQSVD